MNYVCTEADIQFARARSDVKVSVVAGATYNGDSGDSNLGCTWVEFKIPTLLP